MGKRTESAIQKIFISSRSHELRSERIAIHRACLENGHRPLMYEVEPQEIIKDKVDRLVNDADRFIGLYLHTLGPPVPEIYGLTWIEYELVRFIARRCQIFLGKEKKGSVIEQDCFPRLQRILTGHVCQGGIMDRHAHCDFHCPIKRNARCTRTNSYYANFIRRNLSLRSRFCSSGCFRAIVKARKDVSLFHRVPFDEKSLSPALYAFINGLYQLGYRHEDFFTDWDIGQKVISVFPKQGSRPKIENKSEETAWISYRGKDKGGMIAQLSSFLLGMSLNIQDLHVKTWNEGPKNRKTEILVRVTRWVEPQTGEKTGIVDEIKKNKEIARAQEEWQTTNKKVLDKMDQAQRKIFSEYASYCLSRFDIASLDIHSNEPLITSSASDPIHLAIEEGVLVWIIHLNAPGIMKQITSIVAGEEPERSKYKLNIFECALQEGSMSITDPKKQHTIWNYRTTILQTTSLLLGRTEHEKEFKADYRCLNVLRNALSSVMGVESVMIEPRENKE